MAMPSYKSPPSRSGGSHCNYDDISTNTGTSRRLSSICHRNRRSITGSGWSPLSHHHHPRKHHSMEASSRSQSSPFCNVTLHSPHTHPHHHHHHHHHGHHLKPPPSPLLTAHPSSNHSNHPNVCQVLTWPSPASSVFRIWSNSRPCSSHPTTTSPTSSSIATASHHRSSSSSKSLFPFSSVNNKVLNSLIVTLLIVAAFTSALFPTVIGAHWQENIVPKRRINHLRDSDVELFLGNESSIDYFKYLDRDSESLLIGARNVVYNISLSTLKVNRRLEWFSSEEDIRMCKYKGKTEESCQNYIKVLAKLGDDRVLVCGTNAFKPKCRNYQYGPMDEYLVLSEKSGEALSPYDPSYSSSATFYEKNLYVATVAGFTGADPLIYRDPLRTEQFNPKHLNAPSFVSSFPHSGFVYFMFRETAVEYINCGKASYSRIARVCAHDNGGPHKFRSRWTSYTKARLNCSIPGDFPFYFNEIQATSEIVKGLYGGRNDQLIYSVFTTPTNSIGGSAVCAFRLQDIEDAFKGPFKGQKDIDSNWLPVQSSRVPSPRPGECSNDTQSLPEMTINFIKEHPLMDKPVPAFLGAPVLVHTSFKSRFTAIAIDPQIETATGKTFDVMFLGTDNGRVIKAINAASSALSGHQLHNSILPVVIEEIVVFTNGAPITQLIVHHTYYEAKLVVVSPDEIKSIRLHHCMAKTCGECVRLQDPYCSFDLQQNKCTSSRSRYWNRENYVQNVEQGWDPRCPDGRPGAGPISPISNDQNLNYNNEHEDFGPNSLDPDSVIDVENAQGSGSPSAVPIYSGETFALAVVTSVVTSLVFGFIIGYIFSRRCRKEDPGICSPYDDPHSYLDPHSTFANTLGGPGLTRLTANGGPGIGALYGTHGTLEHTYSANHGAGPHGNLGTLVGAKPINLVLNVAPKSNSKNANSSADNKPIQKTLIESTPRYGPLPSLARTAAQVPTTIGSAPMNRRLRAPPPPAYSDLDDFDTDRPSGNETISEPRYQPMPLHQSIARRPLPSQPDSHPNETTNSSVFRRDSTNFVVNRNRPVESIKPTTTSSTSSESGEGDYEDISQL